MLKIIKTLKDIHKSLEVLDIAIMLTIEDLEKKQEQSRATGTWLDAKEEDPC